jgi:hypothetical protein
MERKMSDRQSPLVEYTEFQVVPLGTYIALDKEIYGQVTGIAFYLSGSIMYCVVYWHEGQRKEEWISHGEIKSISIYTIGKIIGFSKEKE